MLNIYLPSAASTPYGFFPAGVNNGVSQIAAGYLGLNHGAVPYKSPSDVRVLDAQKAARLDALVSGAWKRRTVLPFKIWGLAQTNAGVLNVTNRAVYQLPVGMHFVAVRVHVENMAGVAQVGRLASIGVGADASVLAGASATFSPLLFGGVQLHTAPACTVSPGTNSAVSSILSSDILRLSSVPRTDGGEGVLFAYQEFLPTAGNTLGCRVPSVSSTSLALGVTRLKTYFKSGDCVTTPANFTAPTEWDMAPAVWFEFFTMCGRTVVLPVGDSVMQGADNASIPNVGGAARLMMEFNQDEIVLCNQGWTSQNSAAYLQNGLAKLPLVRPSIAPFCPWSPNDTDKYTQVGVDRCIAQMPVWVAACDAVGALPSLVTPAPVGGITAIEEGFRRQVVEAVKSYCATGAARLIDRDAVYTDYTSASGGWKSGLNTGLVHSNATGYALEAATAWAPVLTTVL